MRFKCERTVFQSYNVNWNSNGALEARTAKGFLHCSSKPGGNQEPRGFLGTRNTRSIPDSKIEKDFAGYFGDIQL